MLSAGSNGVFSERKRLDSAHAKLFGGSWYLERLAKTGYLRKKGRAGIVVQQSGRAMGTDANKKQSVQQFGSRDRPWIPRFWSGMNISGWYGLLWRNRFAIGPRSWGMAAVLSLLAVFNSALWLIQELLLGRRIRQTQLVDDPIFVIGHWRSGTTLLHELLALDQRHTYPDTYASFAPNHFLISGWLFRPLLKYLLPARRPMDNMPAGWDHPQEDEFALCNMGERSPYLTITFSNRPPQDQQYLTLEGLPPAAVQRWKQRLLWFLKCLTLRTPKRIVLKSPAHTCRIRVLLEMFPNAKFVHIVRDPLVLFPSTVNLWKRLYWDQGLQTPRYEALEEHVFQTLLRMYEVFWRDQHLLPPGQFCQVRYEELVKDPIGQMRRVYRELDLGQFEQVLPALQQFVAKQAEYKTNRYDITPQMRAKIAERWASYSEQYGYATAASSLAD